MPTTTVLTTTLIAGPTSSAHRCESERTSAQPTASPTRNGHAVASTPRTGVALLVARPSDRREDQDERPRRRRRRRRAAYGNRPASTSPGRAGQKGSRGCGGAWVGSTPSNSDDTERTVVDPGDRLGEQPGHRPDLQVGPAAGAGTVSVVTTSVIIGWVLQPLDGRAGEQPVGAGDRRLGAAEVLEPLQQLDDRAAGGDLVVEDDGPLAGDVADDRVDDDLVVGEPLLAAGRDGQARAAARRGSRSWRCRGRGRRRRCR